MGLTVISWTWLHFSYSHCEKRSDLVSRDFRWKAKLICLNKDCLFFMHFHETDPNIQVTITFLQCYLTLLLWNTFLCAQIFNPKVELNVHKVQIFMLFYPLKGPFRHLYNGVENDSGKMIQHCVKLLHCILTNLIFKFLYLWFEFAIGCLCWCCTFVNYLWKVEHLMYITWFDKSHIS